MPSGPLADPERKHLWVVLTDPCPQQSNLLVSICSLRPDRFHDPACVIEAGEHPRISHKSWVEYRRSHIARAGALVNGEKAWLYKQDAPVCDELFERITTGLLRSDHVPERVKRYYLGVGPAY
jgi:hypothetical protein